jgi:hypothetical protein
VPGHWEGNLLSGSRNTHVATVVERSSRFVMLVRVSGKDTESVVAALSEQIRRLPKTMIDTPDLGPGNGDGRPQAVHSSHRRCGLLLRPEEPLAALFLLMGSDTSEVTLQWRPGCRHDEGSIVGERTHGPATRTRWQAEGDRAKRRDFQEYLN